MAFRLRPHDARFGDLLAALSGHLGDGAQLLAEMLGGDPDEQRATAQRLLDVDQDAEAAAHAVLRALSAAFVTPFDRVDIYRVAWSMRMCTARMSAVADEIVLFEIVEPPPGVTDLVQLVVRAAEVTMQAVPRLGRPRLLVDPWIELTRLGKQAGQAHRRLLADITSTAKEPAELVRLTALAQSLLRVVNSFEEVAHAFQTVSVKEG
ncbi:DUF47 domain-containing protein [Kineosporia sp. A_224]|uniref:DUF47 domain-containing protein n=1 Tax=Kineosporia sp. A_224 TaxID=1962180 RepID=UPI00130474F5|nr:DUF47 family protein [Kineosporia sp. A_224]